MQQVTVIEALHSGVKRHHGSRGRPGDASVGAEASTTAIHYDRGGRKRSLVMLDKTALATIGALVGDPGRASMLAALLDGRALTATELAAHAGVAPPTASGHLCKLIATGLVVVRRQGRHRYHSLASPEVARMLEAMSQMAASRSGGGRPVRLGPRDAALRAARTCYDHLAGRLAVGLTDAMASRGTSSSMTTAAP
jgi:DNA-binding transcriptional ArsR family regulator